MISSQSFNSSMFVVPLAGTWIETSFICFAISSMIVVPLAGTWIETWKGGRLDGNSGQSFPSRERGLKHATVLALLD